MTVSELQSSTGWQAIEPGPAGVAVTSGYTSDLLSDVMAHAPEGSVLITIQGHRNTVAVATLCGIRAIVLCHDRPAPEDMRQAARQEGIAVLSTPEDQFSATVTLARLLTRTG